MPKVLLGRYDVQVRVVENQTASVLTMMMKKKMKKKKKKMMMMISIHVFFNHDFWGVGLGKILYIHTYLHNMPIYPHIPTPFVCPACQKGHGNRTVRRPFFETLEGWM